MSCVYSDLCDVVLIRRQSDFTEFFTGFGSTRPVRPVEISGDMPPSLLHLTGLSLRAFRAPSLGSPEQVEFSLDGRDALELHVEGQMNFRKRSIKGLAKGFQRRFHPVEPVSLLLDGSTIASRRSTRLRRLLRSHA